MKNEQNEKKSRKPLLRIGLTALIGSVLSIATFLISGKITFLRDAMTFAIGADVFVSLYEGARGIVRAISNSKNAKTTGANTKNRVRNRELTETMADIPTEEEDMEYTDVVTNTPVAKNSRKQGR